MTSNRKKPPEERQAGVRIATQQQAFFWGLGTLVLEVFDDLEARELSCKSSSLTGNEDCQCSQRRRDEAGEHGKADVELIPLRIVHYQPCCGNARCDDHCED